MNKIRKVKNFGVRIVGGAVLLSLAGVLLVILKMVEMYIID